MMKKLALVLLLLVAGGCSITDHIRIVRMDSGFLGVGIVFELEDNPLNSLPLL